MLSQTFRGPHSLYRRYQALFESAATATGFAVLVMLALRSIAVYPDNWVVVIAVTIGLVGIRWPIVAYVLGVSLVAYPIFTINLYLAVLFVAVAALGHRWFVHFLGATALVLATPLLAQYHLHWLVPVLGGLWWGGVTGAWVGGLAAMWGKLIAGMAGMNPDWVLLAGHTPHVDMIANRFADANSLDTLLLLIDPFATSSSLMLYHLLQVVGWTVTGAFVGGLASKRWVKYYAPWSVMVVTAGGGLIMLLTHVGLPYWLADAVPNNAWFDPVAPLFSLLVVIIVGTLVYSIRESLDLPVAPKRSMWASRQQKQKSKSSAFSFLKRTPKPVANQFANTSETSFPEQVHARRPVRVPKQSELPEWEPPQADSGLIMLEID